jgi:hypothetical protein
MDASTYTLKGATETCCRVELPQGLLGNAYWGHRFRAAAGQCLAETWDQSDFKEFLLGKCLVGHEGGEAPETPELKATSLMNVKCQCRKTPDMRLWPMKAVGWGAKLTKAMGQSCLNLGVNPLPQCAEEVGHGAKEDYSGDKIWCCLPHWLLNLLLWVPHFSSSLFLLSEVGISILYLPYHFFLDVDILFHFTGSSSGGGWNLPQGELCLVYTWF